VSAWSRLVRTLRGNRLMAEIDEEIDAHLRDAIAAGRDPAEARRALGSPLRHREESRDVRIIV
jgi:putative ABC transport system permease protein